MATATTIYLTDKQRQGLFRRARKRKTSLSEEVREALEFYLGLPPDVGMKDLEALARETKASLDRSNAKLDEASARAEGTVNKLDAINRTLDELAQERL